MTDTTAVTLASARVDAARAGFHIGEFLKKLTVLGLLGSDEAFNLLEAQSSIYTIANRHTREDAR